jgi:hypothetical protein
MAFDGTQILQSFLPKIMFVGYEISEVLRRGESGVKYEFQRYRVGYISTRLFSSIGHRILLEIPLVFLPHTGLKERPHRLRPAQRAPGLGPKVCCLRWPLSPVAFIYLHTWDLFKYYVSISDCTASSGG